MQTTTPAATITIAAPAKLNLSLAVLGRRADGYHAIESLMVAVSVADTLVLRPSAVPGIHLVLHDGGCGVADDIPTDDRNLVVRAIRAVAARAGVEPALACDLVKAIPAGAGLGGGSSDAAAAIRGVARLWGLDWPRERLADIGATVGSDVPWFFAGGAAIASGRGEHVERVAGLPALAAVIVWPGTPLSTAAVYRAWGEKHVDTASRAGDARRLAVALAEERWRDVWPLLHNDLEPPARGLCADVDDSLAALAEAGAIAPRLTGSGSACFALTRTFAEAQTLASRLAARHAPAGEARWPFVRAVRLPVGGGG